MNDYCGFCLKSLKANEYRVHNQCIDDLLSTFKKPNPEQYSLLQPVIESIKRNMKIALTCQMCNILPATYLNNETNIMYCGSCRNGIFQFLESVLPKFVNLNRLEYCNSANMICSSTRVRKKQRKIKYASNYKHCQICNNTIERECIFFIHSQPQRRLEGYMNRYCSVLCYSKHFNH